MPSRIILQENKYRTVNFSGSELFQLYSKMDLLRQLSVDCKSDTYTEIPPFNQNKVNNQHIDSMLTKPQHNYKTRSAENMKLLLPKVNTSFGKCCFSINSCNKIME